jgi:hypothetical protein
MRTQFKAILLSSLLLLAFTVKPQGDISYHHVKGYHFIGEESERTDIFLIIHNDKEWKNFFKPYPGHYVKEVTNIDWNKYIAVGIIKYGNTAWTMQAKRVELDEGELTFEYASQKTDEGLVWKNATPLVVLIPKGKYRALKYIENNTLVRKFENFTGKRDF